MPKQDGTGPVGKGPLTGRGLGDCVVRLSEKETLMNDKSEEVVPMPGGNGTGPMGMGPMTGRAGGFCAGFNAPGYANPVPGRGGMGYGRGFARGAAYGRGLGRGFGRGFGWRAAGAYQYGAAGQTVSSQGEAQILREQVRFMQEEVDAMNSRIKELESQPSPDQNK